MQLKPYISKTETETKTETVHFLIIIQNWYFHRRISFSSPSAEGIFTMYQHVVFVLKDLFHRGKFFVVWLTSLFDHWYFQRKKIIVLSICRGNFSNVRKCGFHFEKYISQKKFLMIGTSTEEFHPVHENVTYNSLFMYLSAERIFPINFKMVFR